jgi:hypothetical protein
MQFSSSEMLQRNRHRLQEAQLELLCVMRAQYFIVHRIIRRAQYFIVHRTIIRRAQYGVVHKTIMRR